TGNLGRPGGGVASPKGPANFQGVTDMGAHPALLPGGLSITNQEARARFEAAWLARWGAQATTQNGFVHLRSLPAAAGLGARELVAAIESGRIKAMIVGNPIAGRFAPVDAGLLTALAKLEFLVVLDAYADTPLGALADVILPQAMSMELDGTYT